MTTKDALKQFREAAIAKGDFAEPKKDAMLHQTMSEAIWYLETEMEGGAAMRVLLSDPKEEVQVWIAAHLLSKGDESAREVLKRLSVGSGPRAFSASMTLSEHAGGRLRSPFPKREEPNQSSQPTPTSRRG